MNRFRHSKKRGWLVPGVVAALALQVAASAQTVEEFAATLRGLLPEHELVEGPKAVQIANGRRAHTFVLRRTSWEEKFPSQRASPAAPLNLPEAELLKTLNRFQDHLQVWLVSRQAIPGADAGLKQQLEPAPVPSRYHRELAWLGNSAAFACYGYLPIYHWLHWKNQLGLTGGDDVLAAAARGLSIEDAGSMTANSVEGWLVQAGPDAIPHLERVIATSKSPRAMRVLGRIEDPAAVRRMGEYARGEDPELVRLARHVLIHFPREEAKDLYFEWFEADAGRVALGELLEACARVDAKRLEPLLDRVLGAPRSWVEFRRVFELSRELNGRPVPEELLVAEEQIKKHGHRSGENFNEAKVREAVATLAGAKDVEASAQIGVALALATTKGDWRRANQAGVSILRQLPNERGRIAARTLAASCPDPWVRERLAELLP